MSKKRLEAQLAAGGMVGVKAKVDDGATEEVVARRYTGEALGDRVIVRLGATRLGPAEDLAMEFLGLQPDGESKPLAKQSRRALGFASWALITHPENAKYALSLVKRMKAAGRKAKSKPGHAWDQFTEMAGELNRSVRHFLPPFWEEAARAYKDLGNTTYAGRAIGKALEAERVHALEVDPHRRRDAVLEFTLSGCLSGKALTEYTKDLQKQFQPDEAFETLKDLLVRRTMGGMPPMQTAAKDLSKFAKAAGKQGDEEIDSFLTSVIASPAMARAPRQFWKSVTKNVARLAAADVSFAMWLLVHTNCESSYYKDSPVWGWIELLQTWKVLPLMGKPAKELPKDVSIPGGRAGWISRLMSVESSPQPILFDVLALAADAVRAEGQPIRLGEGTYYGGVIDVDALEYCLELGLEVSDPPQHRSLDFSGWLFADVDHERRNSGLSCLAADDRFRALMLKQIPELVAHRGKSNQSSYGRSTPPTRSFEAAALGHDAIKVIWWEFLDGHLQSLETGGLRDVEDAMNLLSKCAGEATGKQFPEIAKRLKKVDLPTTLQRTLQAGVLDEYGWETLDAVDDKERLPLSRRSDSRTIPMFPFVTVLQAGKVTTVGPDGAKVLGEFSLTKKQSPEFVVPVGDDAVVVFRDQTSYDQKMVWLSDANNPKPVDGYYYDFNVTGLIPLDDGVFYGTRVLRAGDTKVPSSELWFSDGERYWVMENTYQAWNEFNTDRENVNKASLNEIDPMTGTRGRASIPAWFEESLGAHSRIVWSHCRMQPLPGGCDSSPLGSKDGLLGWRLTIQRDGSLEGRGIDGRFFVTKLDPSLRTDQTGCVAMIDQPAGDGHWRVMQSDNVIDSKTGITIANVSGTQSRYANGQPLSLPIAFWHYSKVRCGASSKQLRKLKLSDAKLFFDAGRNEHEALKIKEDPKNPDPNRIAGATAVRKVLKKAPDRLVKGISRIARIAATEQISLDKLIDRVSGEAAKRASAQKDSANPPVSDDAWLEIESGLAETAILLEGSSLTWFRGYGSIEIKPQQLLDVVEFFKTGKVKDLPKGGWQYFGMIDDTPTAAWGAFWKNMHEHADQGLSVPQRLKGHWLTGLEFLADCGILKLPGTMTLFVTAEVDEATKKKMKAKKLVPSENRPIALVEGKTRYVIYSFGNYASHRFAILTYTESGKVESSKVKPPKAFTIEETIPIRKRWMVSSLKSFVEAVGKVETLPVVSEEKLQWAAEKTGMSSIQVALAWMGNYRSGHYGQEKLTKELRGHYGWKLADIKTAVTALDADPPSPSLLTECVRLDPTGSVLNKVETNFERAVGLWAESLEKTVAIPSDVLAKFQKLVPGYGQFDIKLLQGLLIDPIKSPLLADYDIAYAPGSDQRNHQLINEVQTPKKPFGESNVYPLMVNAICLLNYELPAGDEGRNRLPDLIEAIREYLDRDTTTLPFGENRTEKGYLAETDDKEATLERFSNVVGKCAEGKDGINRIDNGFIVGALFPPTVMLRFRTAKLQKPADVDALIAAGGLTFGYETNGADAIQHAMFVWSMRDDDMDAMIKTNRQNTVANGQWDQDPRQSVPKLVAKVAKKLSVGENAATLYLQVLALHDPSNNNVKKWNDWSIKAVKAAVAELIDGEHLVQAKRSRAGREHFLPGGWEPLKTPNLPIETWKLPIFGFENTDRLRGGYASLIVCPRPVASQFELAWKRVESDDGPKYEDAAV